MRLYKWALVSMLLHILALGASWYSVGISEKALPPPVSVTVVEVLEKMPSVPGHVAGQGVADRGARAAVRKSLFQAYAEPSLAAKTGGNPGEGGSPDFTDRDTYLLDIDSVLGTNDNWGHHREVFRQIDSHLHFDSLLAQYNHFGTVLVQFEVSEKGYLLEDRLRIKADDAVLKVHVVRALRTALAEGLAQNKRNAFGEVTLFKAKFEFTLGAPEQNYSKQKDFGQSVLVFQRSTTEQALQNNVVDHLAHGGISSDPTDMVDKWKKYKKRQMLKAGDYDPFAHYKRDPAYLL